MNKIRIASLVLGLTLVIAVIAFTQIFVRPSSAENTDLSLQGMGDLHLVESQQGILPLTGVQISGQSTAGMGDLRFVEARQNITLLAGVQTSSRSTTGMGDLHLYDSRQVKKSTGSSAGYAGMGDLHRFEITAVRLKECTNPNDQLAGLLTEKGTLPV